jgi:dipeptidyl aminopeptidase/acylaminoacyl peptidase
MANPLCDARLPRLLAYLAMAVVSTAAHAQVSDSAGSHEDLNDFVNSAGKHLPIKTPADWEQRRAQVMRAVQEVMGPLPSPASKTPLEVQTLEESRLGKCVRRKIAYHTDSENARIRAWLFIPDSEKGSKRAAVLCLHQTTPVGKDEPAGVAGQRHFNYALELAEQGFVTLAPDYPSFGEYPYDFAHDEYTSGSMKAIYDNIRAVDLLQSLPEVDPEKIGCIGHSLGGHNAIFTAVFEPRIKAVVSSCGFTQFSHYYGGDLKGWTSERYMPRIASEYGKNPARMPFDFTELIAALAPRPFMAVAPVKDDNFDVEGVRRIMAAAAPIYRLYDAEAVLKAAYPEGGHDFPTKERKKAYEFLQQHLGAEK